MKKIIALFAAAMLLALWGCENVEYIDTSTQKNESSTDIYEQLQSEMPLPDTDDESTSGGTTPVATRPFVIVTDDSTAFYQDESNMGTIGTALEERNTFLRDNYRADIKVIEADYATIEKELKSALENGTEYCDMISVSAENTVKLYKQGLLADMASLPGFSIESSYFNPVWAKSLATNNSLYMLADPTALVYDDVYVMLFNRDLVADDIESMVMKGEWDWTKFDEVCRTAAADVYSHSSADMNTDVFAFGAYELETVFPLAMWTSCGNKLIDNTYKNPVAIGMESEEVIAIGEFLMDVYNVRGKFPLGSEDARTAFEEGRLAFYFEKLEYFYSLRDGTTKGSNYGFVPLPKYNAEQTSYCTPVSLSARVISLPKTLENADESKKKFVSTILSATCAAGGKTVTEAYINSKLALYLNSNSETVMLQTICNSVTFDFATVYGSVIEEIRTPTIKAIADYLDYGSKLSSSLRKGKQTFQKYCDEHFK